MLGGSTPTDPLILEPFPTLMGVAVTHDQYKTVGSLLLSTLQCSSGAFSKVFQSYFEQTFECTNSHLSVSLQYSDDASPLNVMFEWKPFANGTSPMARRLAAIYFPKSADFVAAWYRSFDQAASLEAITPNLDAEFLKNLHAFVSSLFVSSSPLRAALRQKALPLPAILQSWTCAFPHG